MSIRQEKEKARCRASDRASEARGGKKTRRTDPSGFFKQALKAPAWTIAALLALATPALALMPPYVYETARKDAKNLIVFAVDAVQVPKREFGTCTVSGSVRVVERGETYKAGQKVELAVPCSTRDASPPLGGTIYQPMETLSKSKFGRAWLDADGKVVLSQYEQLAALP